MDKKFGPVTIYFKHISQKQHAGEHATFMSALSEWVKQHNDDSSLVRLKSKGKLLGAQVVVDVAHSVGGRFKAKRQFVTVACWKEEYGPIPKDRICTEKVG
jgi:hypothetical protein